MAKWCGKCRRGSNKRTARVDVLGKTHRLESMMDKGFVFQCGMAAGYPITDGKPAWTGRVEGR